MADRLVSDRSNSGHTDRARCRNSCTEGDCSSRPASVAAVLSGMASVGTGNRWHPGVVSALVAGDILTITEQGLRHNIDVGLQYLEAWLGGNGCVPIYNLMEDAATAEISRSQLWQWVHNGAKLDDGRTITPELYRALVPDVLANISTIPGAINALARFFVSKRLEC